MAAAWTRFGDLTRIATGLVRSGRGAGARPGDWQVRLISVGDIQDDRLNLAAAEEIAIELNARTEKYALAPGDVLISARSTAVKVALVPTRIERAVADATLLVAKPIERFAGVGHFLWWYLSSAPGKAALLGQAHVTTMLSLSAAALADVMVPVPPLVELSRLVDLIEASETAYATAIEAAQLRRTLFREGLIERLVEAADEEEELSRWR